MESCIGDYFIIQADAMNESIPFLRADSATSMQNYHTATFLSDGAPLVFTDGFRGRHGRPGGCVSDILFEGANIVVKQHIRDALIEFELKNVTLYPAIYIDELELRHQDYWYVAFTSKLDCWKRETSEYLENPVELGGEKLYEVLRFELNEEILRRIPLGDRLLFKMGGCMPAHVVAHECVLNAFVGNLNGVQFVKIEDY